METKTARPLQTRPDSVVLQPITTNLPGHRLDLLSVLRPRQRSVAVDALETRQRLLLAGLLTPDAVPRVLRLQRLNRPALAVRAPAREPQPDQLHDVICHFYIKN